MASETATNVVSECTAQEPGFSPESWRSARAVVEQLLPVITPLHSAVRVLTSHVIEEEVKLRCLTWMLRFPSFRSAVCGFCGSVYPESKFEPHSVHSVRMKELLGFDVCAVILGLLIGYRRLKRTAPGAFVDDYPNALHQRAEIGFHLGREIPELGSAAGMLLGGIRDLALGLIRAAKAQEFGAYRRHIDREQIPFDLEYEIDEWGFSHPQVMALVTQILGFGHPPAIAFFIGLAPLRINSSTDLWASRFRTVASWIEDLYGEDSPRNSVSLRGFTITDSDLQKLGQLVVNSMKSRSSALWLEGGYNAGLDGEQNS